MYILEVGLKNYQSHSNTIVPFSKGVNAIIGGSAEGKTAIKRAIECVLYNRYSTADYIKEGEDKYTVYIKFSTGHIITRERGRKRGNKYIIEYPDGTKSEFSSFGKNVPEEVTDIHKMYLIDIGKRKNESLNCAYQLDGPFFLQDTPQDRAAIIGSIAKTQLTDKAVVLTLEKSNSIKTQMKAKEKQAKTLKEKIDSLEFVSVARVLLDEIKNKYTYLKETKRKYEESKEKVEYIKSQSIEQAKKRVIIEAYSDCEATLSRIDLLTELVRRYNRAFNDLKYLDDALKNLCKVKDIILNLDEVDELSETCENIETLLSKYNKSKKLFDNIFILENQKENNENIVNNLTDLDELTELVDLLEIDMKKLSTVKEIKGEIDVLDKRIEKGKSVISQLSDNINQKTKEYSDLLIESGKCPTCFSVIDNDVVEQVENEFI